MGAHPPIQHNPLVAYRVGGSGYIALLLSFLTPLKSKIDDVAAEMGIKVLGKMPIDPALAEMVEEEKFYEVENEYLKDAIEVLK